MRIATSLVGRTALIVCLTGCGGTRPATGEIDTDTPDSVGAPGNASRDNDDPPSCAAGMVYSGTACVDVLECANNTHNCHARATCAETDDGFTCTCDAGFSGDGVDCVNLDECADGSDSCHEHAACIDLPGTYACTCQAGYSGDGRTCTNVNECLSNTDDCDERAICTDSAGSFSCACPPAFSGDGATCHDVLECRTENGGCGAPAAWTCHEVVGGEATCRNVDECASAAPVCHKNATCVDIDGGFQCQCAVGASCETCAPETQDNDGSGTCEETCAAASLDCGTHGTCSDQSGKAVCVCDTGYSGPACSYCDRLRPRPTDCIPPYDPTPAWPLCGRILDNPPAQWNAGIVPTDPYEGKITANLADDCPADRFGSPTSTDLPIRSSYGPRRLVSSGGRYDFHRGIDLATPVGTPVFAIADGVVRIAGVHASYADPVIQVRHFRPNAGTSCSAGGGCYHALYLHMASWAVDANQTVVKGQFLGRTGESRAGSDDAYAHLHFEIRDATPDDPFSSWQRDTIHPLHVLPYTDVFTTHLSLSVDRTDPTRPVPTVVVNIPATEALDLRRVEVHITDVAQRAEEEADSHLYRQSGWYLNPPWFDVDAWNAAWSHKDSSGVPWSSFADCPYASSHPANYSADAHMDQQDPSETEGTSVGLFNGVRISPEAVGERYEVRFEFLALSVPTDFGPVCITATIHDVSGRSASVSDGSACP